MGQRPVKEAFLQVHGKLTSAGTSRQCDAALLSGEEEERPARLYLARTDKDEMAPVTIREVLPSIGGGDTRIRLSTGDIFTISGTADLSAVSLEGLVGSFEVSAARNLLHALSLGDT